MKTLLNLLPEEKKESTQGRLRLRFLLWQLFLLFVLEIFYLSILIGTYLVLDFQLRSLNAIKSNATVSQEETTRLHTYESKFKDINKTVEVVSSIDRFHLYFSQVFVLIDTLVPEGVVVDHLITTEYTVSLFGKAVTRERMLEFDENLKGASECITDVDIPIQNLFSQEDIDFQVDFTLKPECLRKSTL